jgi:rhodanese-related sulfurtransferase
MNIFKALFSGGTNAVTSEEAKTRVDSKEPLFILDVRQPDEFRAAHISGAKLIPLSELGKRVGELPKDQPILCVCASGSRSSVAASQLSGAGYDVLNLRGGMAGWMRAGYPVKKGK